MLTIVNNNEKKHRIINAIKNLPLILRVISIKLTMLALGNSYVLGKIILKPMTTINSLLRNGVLIGKFLQSVHLTTN